MSCTDCEEETPSIRQAWCRCRHTHAERTQIPVQLAIIKGAQGDLNDIVAPDDCSRELEKGRQPFPGGMGVVGRKIHLAHPHHQVSQGDFTDRHRWYFTRMFERIYQEKRPVFEHSGQRFSRECSNEKLMYRSHLPLGSDLCT